MSTTDVTTTPDRFALAVTGLEPDSAMTLRQTFEGLFAQADEWCARARAIKVTSVDQKREMKLARESRLALREIRTKAEHARKRLKEDCLRRGKAIDGVANVIKALIEPIEEYLQEQESFAARAEETRRDALHDARKSALAAYGVAPEGMPAALGMLSEEAWGIVLDDAKRAQESRAEQARLAEEARVEAARIVAEKDAARRAEQVRLEAERQAHAAEQKAENERLRAEAKARDEEQAAERARVAEERRRDREKAEQERRAAEALRAEEMARETAEAAEAKRVMDEAVEQMRAEQRAADEARARAEAEAAQLRQAEEDRRAREAETKKPTKAKYMAMVDVLKRIAGRDVQGVGDFEPNSAGEAQAVLRDIGELPAEDEEPESGPRVAP